MTTDALVSSLEDLLGKGRVVSGKSDLVAYCSDYFRRTSFESFGAWPRCAVLPETTLEVSEIVKLAIAHRSSIVPRGGGSNQVGAVIPNEGCIVLSTARMNRIIEIDEVNMTVTAQPGINLKAMDDELAPHGLVLAQEQGSYKVANIGGAVSTNGFSLRNARYRGIGDKVLSMEVVLGDGRILRTGRKVCSNSSGYPLHKLFVGAEGTLGIITELTLTVNPRPEKEIAIAATFDSWEAAERAALGLNRSGINLAGGYAAEAFGASGKKIDVVIVGMEGNIPEVESSTSLARKLLERNGGEMIGDDEAWAQWRSMRSYWCGTPHPNLAVEDLVAAMPLQSYGAAHRKIEEEVFPRYGITMNPADYRVMLIGPRPLVCFNFLYDPKKLPLERLQQALGEMMGIVAEFGGHGPGCHAVGLLLRGYFTTEHDGTRLEVMKQLKRMFDPHGILNPGKKLIV